MLIQAAFTVCRRYNGVRRCGYTNAEWRVFAVPGEDFQPLGIGSDFAVSPTCDGCVAALTAKWREQYTTGCSFPVCTSISGPQNNDGLESLAV